MRTNVNSFYYLLAKAQKDRSIIVYASSAATYGNEPSPQTEGQENPQNPYGYSKYAMDQITDAMAGSDLATVKNTVKFICKHFMDYPVVAKETILHAGIRIVHADAILSIIEKENVRINKIKTKFKKDYFASSIK